MRFAQLCLVPAIVFVLLALSAAPIASAHVAKKKHHHILTIDNSIHASVVEDEGASPTNMLFVKFKVDINGGLPNETYDVNSNMVDRCDAVAIIPVEGDAESGLGDVVTNLHGNAEFFVEGSNCIPNDNPNFDEGDYSLWITGDSGSHTSASVGFEIVE